LTRWPGPVLLRTNQALPETLDYPQPNTLESGNLLGSDERLTGFTPKKGTILFKFHDFENAGCKRKV